MTKYCSVEGCTKPIRARGLCSGHWTKWARTGIVGGPLRSLTKGDLKTRLLAHVHKAGDCWEWTGTISAGYGQIRLGQKGTPMVLAHRASFEVFVGPIPDGLQIDHLCRNPKCINPDHLEPVTPRENILRGNTLPAKNANKNHCIHGHPFDEANTYINSNGSRSCRTCKREWARRQSKKKRHEEGVTAI